MNNNSMEGDESTNKNNFNYGDYLENDMDQELQDIIGGGDDEEDEEMDNDMVDDEDEDEEDINDMVKREKYIIGLIMD